MGSVLGGVLVGVYGLLCFVAWINALGMRRIRPSGKVKVAKFPSVLIPARDEEENLKELVPLLTAQGLRVYVYDDDSSDKTAEVARTAGAIVIKGRTLPEGWRGKCHACHQLALAASEDSPDEWWVFIDADTRPLPDFAQGMANWIESQGKKTFMLTGFPKMNPGAGFEPLYLAWVPWILLATNPFALVSRTRKGHSFFANGQVQLWRASTYMELLPHQAVKQAVLEDVAIGRLMAKRGQRVEVANWSSALSVTMYKNFPEAWQGMLKNSAEIAGRGAGSWLFALLLLTMAWAWLAAGSLTWICLGLLLASWLGVWVTVRLPVFSGILLPITLTLAAITVAVSDFSRSRGRSKWKGRPL